MDKVGQVNRLIARISRGDTSALEQLFELTGGHMNAVAKRYLIDKSLAGDLISEVFVRLIRYSSRFDESKNGLNWLFKTVHNTAIDWNKKYNPYANCCIDEVSDLALVVSELDGVEDRLALADALAALTEEERKVLYHKFWECLTVREIAEIIHKPRSTVQNLIDRALAKVGKLYGGSDKS